jgi:aminopeptidase YwaD
MKRLIIILLAPFLFQTLTGQETFDFSDDAVIQRLKDDIYTLASEELEGREAGTEGEQKAADYIKNRMLEIGLQPFFDGSFFQEFPFPGEWVWGEDNSLTYNGQTFSDNIDFYVLPGSASGSRTKQLANVGFGITGMDNYEGFEGYCDFSLHEDLEDRIFIMEYYLPEALDTVVNQRPLQLLFQKIRNAEENGAAGIIFINTQTDKNDPPIDLRFARRVFEMPILFAGREIADHLLADDSGLIDVQTDIYRTENTAINVAGYLDNDAEHTVVIGAHYDHMGYGGRGSRSPETVAIHYGADDNASGTAAVLEAARYISSATSPSNYNYLFIAFSAEEKGLIGSRYFTESEAYDLEKVNYMFNFDMIGRMQDETLTLIGTGSSPAWDGLIDDNVPAHFTVNKNPGGRGGSDHTSFYVNDIPVIFFFTGIHDDYHTPRDTPDKINYEATHEIIAFGMDLVMELDEMERLEFSSAPAPATTRRRSDSVTLGLMPDHGFGGEGLRVLSVTDDRPAKNAGIENGDIIISINDMKVLEIHSYMEALGGLNPGNTATVTVQRGEEQIEFEVEL